MVWPLVSQPQLWPHTLEYRSSTNCTWSIKTKKKGMELGGAWEVVVGSEKSWGEEWGASMVKMYCMYV